MDRTGCEEVEKVSDEVMHEYDIPMDPPVRKVVWEKRVRYDAKTAKDIAFRFNYSKESLDSKRVLVVGAGTLGNLVAMDLVFSGVSDLTIVDMDTIEYYNLPRSPLFRMEDVSQSKSLTMARRAAEASPFPVRCTGIDADITRLGFGFLEGFDVLVSVVDSWSVRMYLSQGASLLGITHISCGTAVIGAYSNIMASTITLEPAGCKACYGCMVPGTIRDQEKKLSCLDYKPETQPQVLSFSSSVAGMTAQSVVQHMLGRLNHGVPDEFPKAWKYLVRELGVQDDSEGNTICVSRSTTDGRCAFHSSLGHLVDAEIREMTVSRGETVRSMQRKMAGIIGHDGVFEVDLRWASLYNLVFPIGSTSDDNRTPPFRSLFLEDRDDMPEDRLLIARMPPDHIYMVTDRSVLDGDSVLVRLRLEEE